MCMVNPVCIVWQEYYVHSAYIAHNVYTGHIVHIVYNADNVHNVHNAHSVCDESPVSLCFDTHFPDAGLSDGIVCWTSFKKYVNLNGR